jgi:hypothetical protein
MVVLFAVGTAAENKAAEDPNRKTSVILYWLFSCFNFGFSNKEDYGCVHC